MFLGDFIGKILIRQGRDVYALGVAVDESKVISPSVAFWQGALQNRVNEAGKNAILGS